VRGSSIFSVLSCQLPVASLLLAMLAAPAGAQGHPVTGAQVLSLTQQYVDVAPKRYDGSPGHQAAEQFIKDHFKPEMAKGNFVTDSFYAKTPVGAFGMDNLIVKFPGKRDGIIVLASHYETNYPLKDIHFIGANDGGCTTALLIALGQYYREHPPQGYSVWLLFTDGEEAFQQWSDSDSLYGSRHLAAKWSGDGTLGHIKAFLLADMIGWKQMKIDRDANSTAWLEDDLAKAAKETGHSGYLASGMSGGFDDDHLPFQVRGVPVLDVIDYEYGTASDPEAFHHTEKDTMDKLSAQSLQVSADIFLDLVKLVNQR